MVPKDGQFYAGSKQTFPSDKILPDKVTVN